MKYIIIVRNYPPAYGELTDVCLWALDNYYVSPIVELDMESDWEKALNEFEDAHRKFYPKFRYPNYELIPITQAH